MTPVLLTLAVVGALLIPGLGLIRFRRRERVALSAEQVPELVLPEPLDEPIISRRDDALGRAAYADLVASDLREEPRGVSAVYAVAGAWGSGKTSFMNMVAEALREEPARVVLHFNPWLFAGAEQLMQRFFLETAAQVRVALPSAEGDLGPQLENYGRALSPLQWIPLAGPWIGRAGQLAGAASNIRKRRGIVSIEATRDALEGGLRDLDEPIFVFIDDVDRLEATEIRELLRLVRLVAHLPNIVYLLAFDQVQVHAALSSEGMDGRAYLEKIVQKTYDVPLPAADRTLHVLLTALDAELVGIDHGPVDSERWPDVLAEVVHPLISSLRDAKRYVAGVVSSLKVIGDEVDLVDVLALEAIRLFLPQSFALLSISPKSFAGASSSDYAASSSEPEPSLLRFLESSDRPEVLRAVCMRLFPGTSAQLGGARYGADWSRTWRRNRRVADPEMLGFYLQRVPTRGLLSIRATRLLADSMLAGDATGMTKIIEAVDDQQLEDVIEGLEDYERDFNVNAAEAGVPILAGLYGKLPESDRGMFQLSPDIKVERVVLRLLRAVTDESNRLEIVRRALESAPLFGRFRIVNLVGHRDGVGQELVDPSTAERLEDELRDQIVSRQHDALASSPALSLLYWVLTTSEGSRRADVDEVLLDDRVLAATLADAITEVRRQSMGAREVRRESRLAWEPLVEVLGSDNAVEAAVQRLTKAHDTTPQLAEALDLARRYLSGWRPDDFRGRTDH